MAATINHSTRFAIFCRAVMNCAPYFRTWVSVSLDRQDWFLASPLADLHKATPVYGTGATSSEIATYVLHEEADYKFIAEALDIGVVAIYTEESVRGLVWRWNNHAKRNYAGV